MCSMSGPPGAWPVERSRKNCSPSRVSMSCPSSDSITATIMTKAKLWLTQLGNPYTARAPSIRDGRTAINWGVYGAPETFLVDAQGRVIFKFISPMTAEVWEKRIPAADRRGPARRGRARAARRPRSPAALVLAPARAARAAAAARAASRRSPRRRRYGAAAGSGTAARFRAHHEGAAMPGLPKRIDRRLERRAGRAIFAGRCARCWSPARATTLSFNS